MSNLGLQVENDQEGEGTGTIRHAHLQKERELSNRELQTNEWLIGKVEGKGGRALRIWGDLPNFSPLFQNK